MENYTEKVVNHYGDVFYFNAKGKLHRLDGPAVEYSYGTKEWWNNNSLHRDDGPAVEFSNGKKVWWVCNNLHRLDGPALLFLDIQHWYIKHKEYTKSCHNRLVLFYKLEPKFCSLNL